jgi:hypothetical protein
VGPTNIHVCQHNAFVAQDDFLLATATLKGAICFLAKLRLPRSNAEHELDKLTKRMESELKLTTCADPIICGALI